MRDLSGTQLEAAQQAVSRKPYIYLLFTSADGNTTYNYSFDPASATNRLRKIHHEERQKSTRATITLRNNDRALPDLRGYWTEIGYGDYTVAGGNEYKKTPRLWVKSQSQVSAPGNLNCTLELEGMHEVLAEQPFQISGTSAPFFTYNYTSTTPYNIITDLLDEVSFTLAALGTDDGKMDTLEPNFHVNRQPYENLLGVVFRCLNMTESYLRLKIGLEWEVVYPQANDAVDQTYYSNQAPWFYTLVERRNVLVPNNVKVFGNRGSDGLWSSVVTGEASDIDESDGYMVAPLFDQAALLGSTALAADRAVSILAHAKTLQFAARVTVPHDVSVELYDNPRIVDSRGT